MATKRRETINRRKLAIYLYSMMAIVALIGAVVGFAVGRFTAPDKTKTVTIPETVGVPTYSPGKLPEESNVNYFNVPLSHNLQKYIYEVCSDEEIPVTLVMAMIDHESGFNSEAVSKTDDYGLMQINAINHEELEEKYRAADMLNPYQNVFCGVKMISSYIKKYEGDYEKALMAYNMGDYGAKKAWASGITSTTYTESILELMSEYEQEVTGNADGSQNE